MSAKTSFDEQKLKNLVVYVSAQNDANEKFGMTKLNKLLFFSDFTAFARLGGSITGAKYIKMPFGPCPRELDRAIAELKVESRIFQQRLSSGHAGTRIRAICDADISAFTAPEISIVDEMIRRYWNVSGTEISDISHDFVGWELTALRDEIPYYTVMVPDRPKAVSVAVMAEARRRADEIFGP